MAFSSTVLLPLRAARECDRPASRFVRLVVFAELTSRTRRAERPCWRSVERDGRPASLDELGVLEVGAVSFGLFDDKQNKALPRSYLACPEFEVKAGDFLMSRANTRVLVGACAFVYRTCPRLMLSDKIFRFVFRQLLGVVPDYPDYLEQILKSPALRHQIELCASGTSPTIKIFPRRRW